MIDEKIFLIQGENFFDDDIDMHMVRKGIFIETNETQLDDILLTLCGRYVYEDEPDIPGYLNEDWFNDWDGHGGCELCFNNLLKAIKS